MIYAPVAIPTLNRYEHLKRLIDSLEKNTWVEDTELIISLDYPPSEKYVDGFKKNKEYLNKLKEVSRFKKVTIIEQKNNLGPVTNALWLIEYLIENNYDRWIFTEDDNVFSRNFIMYMDKGLELYEKDYSVQAICGCHNLGNYKSEGNVVKQIWYHPHGQGVWANKFIIMKNDISNILMSNNTYSFKSVFGLFRHSKFLFQYYVCNVLCDRTGWMWTDEASLKLFDITQSLYNYFTNSCCIVPIKYKSHSCGFDGSGVHEPKGSIDSNKEWPLDEDKTFEYKQPGLFVVEKSSYKALNKNFRVGNIYLAYVWLIYILFRLSGNNWKFVHRVICGIRKLKSENNKKVNTNE